MVVRATPWFGMLRLQTGFRDKDGKLIYEKDEITEEDRQLVIDRLERHIEAVMTHFGDSVYAWDVVNEAVSDDAAYILRPDSPWYRILGDDFIKIAFRKAHEVDPDAKLFYNDYNAEMAYKRGRVVALLRDLINEGVPIHGIGIQGHWGVNGPSVSEIEDGIRLYADMGLEIHITELDVGMDGRTPEEQAERYRELFELFKKYSYAITNVTLWGIADDASWRSNDNPLLFDRTHKPKPAFWAVVDTSKPWHVNKADRTVFSRTVLVKLSVPCDRENTQWTISVLTRKCLVWRSPKGILSRSTSRKT